MQTVVETPAYLVDADRLFSSEERAAIDDLPLFLLAAFAKNEKANLSAAERNALGKAVAGMLQNYRKRT